MPTNYGRYDFDMPQIWSSKISFISYFEPQMWCDGQLPSIKKRVLKKNFGKWINPITWSVSFDYFLIIPFRITNTSLQNEQFPGQYQWHTNSFILFSRLNSFTSPCNDSASIALASRNKTQEATSQPRDSLIFSSLFSTPLRLRHHFDAGPSLNSPFFS